MTPERPCPPAPARSIPDAPPSRFSLHFANDEGAGGGGDDLVALPKFGTRVTGLTAPHQDAAKTLQWTQPGRPVKLHIEVYGRRKLREVECRRKRGAHGVVEHRREKSALHVSGRVEKFRPCLELGFNRA